MIRANVNPRLACLFKAYSAMPNQGAMLQVLSDGRVSDGYSVLVTFKSKSSACRQLRIAGFLPLHGGMGWKIYPAANAANGRS
jgi:hypothetical protein